ncbi:MAG TPA: AbrB family transcriptional regulator [Lentisphaeria bacterium]|nr:AbrB family transcriptional regulator [Lentisphaeria bacterium]
MIMTTALVTSKGQIVIPVGLRRKFNIRKGAKLFVEEKGDSIMLRPVSAAYFDKFAGILPTKGKLTKALLDERIKERQKEG